MLRLKGRLALALYRIHRLKARYIPCWALILGDSSAMVSTLCPY